MLFDKHGRGSEELYELTGLFYSSNNFRTISSEIAAATEVVASMVGHDIIVAAEDSYISTSPDMKFVDTVRLPVACLAIRNWAKQNLLAHEDTGRKMKVEDGDKMPFEWMIDRDDRELREKYYRSLDALWRYIDADRDKWGSSYAENESLIKTIDELEKVFPVEGSMYTFHLMLPLFVEVQRSKLEKFISAAKMVDIKTSPEGRLASLAKRFVILSALSVAVKRWSIAVFPLMVARRFAPSYQGNEELGKATLHEIEWYLGNLAYDIADVKAEIQELISSENAGGWNEVQLVPENDPRKKFFTC